MKLISARTALLFVFLGATAQHVRAQQVLTVEIRDPKGDMLGDKAIDVTGVSLTFSRETGEYKILVQATSENPFHEQDFRINLNLFNPDAPSAAGFFSDSSNDHPVTRGCLPASFPYRVRPGEREYVLTGRSDFLKQWKSGDRVAGSSQVGSTNSSNPRQIVVDVESSPLRFGSGVLTATAPDGALRQIVPPVMDVVTDIIDGIGILHESTIRALTTGPGDLRPERFAMGGIFQDLRGGRFAFAALDRTQSESVVTFDRTFTTALQNNQTETLRGSGSASVISATMRATARASSTNLRESNTFATACSAIVHTIQADIDPAPAEPANLFAVFRVTSSKWANDYPTVLTVGSRPTDVIRQPVDSHRNALIRVPLGKIDLRFPFNLFWGITVKAPSGGEAEAIVDLEEIRLTSDTNGARSIPMRGLISASGLVLEPGGRVVPSQ